MSDMFAGAPCDYSDDAAIQRALISEHAADSTYRDILRFTINARVKQIVEEIIRDEENHQGRLQGLLIELRGGDGSIYESCFCAGLKQEENPLVTE